MSSAKERMGKDFWEEDQLCVIHKHGKCTGGRKGAIRLQRLKKEFSLIGAKTRLSRRPSGDVLPGRSAKWSTYVVCTEARDWRFFESNKGPLDDLPSVFQRRRQKQSRDGRGFHRRRVSTESGFYLKVSAGSFHFLLRKTRHPAIAIVLWL